VWTAHGDSLQRGTDVEGSGRSMPTHSFQAITVEHGPLTLRSSQQGDDHVVALHGELDIAGVEALDEELRRVAQAGATRVTIDLSGLEFLDSTGLRCLLRFAQRAERNGTEARFVRGQRAVQQVFEITGTDERLAFLD
jgi:anti-sigma B factor antagonist